MVRTQQIAEVLRPLAEKIPEVLAVYVFGSVATGRATAGSDVDLAILLASNPGPRWDLLQFMLDVDKAIGKSTDVVVLNRAGEHLKYLVRRDGIVIFDRAPQARKRFEIRSRKAYEDFLYLHRRYAKKMLKDLSRGG